MDRECCTHAEEQKYISSFFWGNLKEIDGLDTVALNGRGY
jgi:hypothetical protein